jgi:lipopolysaccharide/colanic/teichoic acid biosynthesis glycosyltransferase
MYRDADRRLEALLASDEAARAEWSTHFKLRNDPRVLPWPSSLIRSTSLDELPQIINVIAGDMRLVGPRPFPTYHLEAMSPAFRAARNSVKPGLTGFWQISERSEAELARAEELDGFYIENRSFWFDAEILLSTPQAVIRGGGAY